MEKPSCWYCQFGQRDKGSPGSYWEPPEPSAVYCETPNAPEADVEYLDAAERCPHYKPLIMHCERYACGKEIGPYGTYEPIYTWIFQGDRIEVCSEACRQVIAENNRVAEEEWKEWHDRAKL